MGETGPIQCKPHVWLFGGFRLIAGDGTIVPISGRRSRGVFAYLLLASGQSASRDRLCSLFWGDRGDDQARSSLRQCLLELRAAFELAGISPFEATRERVTLQPGSVLCDAVETVSRLAGLATPAAIEVITEIGAGSLMGDLDLGGAFGEWQGQIRPQLDRVLAAAVQTHLDRLNQKQDWPGVIALADLWLRRDPLDEDVTAAAIIAEQESGASAAAKRRYQHFKQALSHELGVEPGARIQAALSAVQEKAVAKAALEAATAREPLLAVMAFDNLSSDPELDYFSEGISDEILQNVARTTAIKVIARGSSFQFRGRNKLSSAIAAQLGASHLLDGTVRRSGNKVRISAVLIECATQTTLWSNRFDRELADIFTVQDEIAEAVARGLERHFASAQTQFKIDPAAYDRYLRARSLSGAPANADQCIALFEEVIQAEPEFAAAWASLAMARAVATRWLVGKDAFEASRARALQCAERAVALDPAAGLPLVTLSLLESEHSLVKREELLKRAMAASPNDAEVLKHAADFAGSVGRMVECRTLTLRAAQLDPMNATLANNAAVALADMGEVDQAYREFDTISARWPNLAWLRVAPVLIAALRRDWPRVEQFAITDEADDRFYKIAQTTADLMRLPLEASGPILHNAAAHQLEKYRSVELGLLINMFACGMDEEGFACVDRASFARDRASRSGGAFLTSIIFGITNEKMRRDRRFLALCAKLGLCDYWLTSQNWPDCAGEASCDYDFQHEAKLAQSRLTKGV